MIRAGILALALPLGACGAAQGVQATTDGQSTQKQHDFVGTTRYFTKAAQGCETSVLTIIDCRAMVPVKAGTKITVLSMARRPGGGLAEAFEVDAGGRTFFVPETTMILATASEKVHAAEMAEKKECDRKGGISVGMTAEQVLKTCWGKPSRVNKTYTARSQREQWVYGSSYVYVENGVVTAIQTSER